MNKSLKTKTEEFTSPLTGEMISTLRYIYTNT